ncbi:MAG: FHA domain-containing protein [Planctomycetota bacterium]|jgi:hypothetical protein
MPHLITTNGARLPLRRGEGYLLGRGHECDIVVDDVTCSRRHAMLTLDDRTGAYIEDLSSANGTQVNGRPVEDRADVRQGSRIQVGKAVFLLELHDSDSVVDTGTVSLELRPAAADVDGGQLDEYGLLALLKLLMAGGKDIALHVALADDDAQIDLRGGEVMAASCGGLTGFNALVRVARAGAGIFWVVPADGEELDRNINDPHLLVELERCL